MVQADYDAELHRNKHYIGEKEKVMRVLEARAARIAALVAAAKQEGGALLAICNSLRAVAEELEAMWAIMQLRYSNSHPIRFTVWRRIERCELPGESA